MTQWLRAIFSLAEDNSLIPSIYFRLLTNSRTSSTRGKDDLFWTPWHLVLLTNMIIHLYVCMSAFA